MVRAENETLPVGRVVYSTRCDRALRACQGGGGGGAGGSAGVHRTILQLEPKGKIKVGN